VIDVKFAEHETVRLRKPNTEYNLAAESIGAVLQVYASTNMYLVEFADADGVAVALLELSEADIEPYVRHGVTQPS
jgi:hypothetical protein